MVNFENKEARKWEKKAEKIRIQSKKGTILKIGQFFQDKFDKTLKGKNEILKRTIEKLKNQKIRNLTQAHNIQSINNKVAPQNNKIEKAPVVKKQNNNKVATKNNKFGKLPIAKLNNNNKSKKIPVLPRGNYME